jgi:serine/threonine protein phosphatase PrpC
MGPVVTRYRSVGDTNAGQVRQNNEDAYHHDDERGIYVVIDGMGGHAAGEVAADIAKREVQARLERQTDSVERRIREAIGNANNAIFKSSQDNPEQHGMACVLTVAVVKDGKATVGHVGDTRLYKVTLKGGARITKVTRDHSPVGELEDRGEITEFQAMAHPRRNEVFRDVGSQPYGIDDLEFIDITEVPFEPDTAILMCSDGLTDALTKSEIERVIESNAGSMGSIVRELVDRAIEKGKDNITVVWVEGPEFAVGVAPRRPQRDAAITERNGRTTRSVLPIDDEIPRPASSFDLPVWAWLIIGSGIVAALIVGAGIYLRKSQQPDPPPVVALGPRVWTVAPEGADHTSISGALAVANPGDTIEVDSGEYVESVVLKSGVNITGKRAYAAIIVPAGPGSKGISGSDVRDVKIAGLTVRGDPRTPFDVGILIRGGSVSIEKVQISGAAQAGVRFEGGATGAIVGCYIHHNAGPGVVLADGAVPAVRENTISDNGRLRRQPGLLILSGLPVHVAGNTFMDNGGGPAWVAGAVDPNIQTQNRFSLDGKPNPNARVRSIPLQGGRR